MSDSKLDDFVTIKRAGQAPSIGVFADGIVYDNGVERRAIVCEREAFRKRYLTGEHDKRPAGQADWKAAIWYCGAPKPTLIESVEIKFSQCGEFVCMLWNLKEVKRAEHGAQSLPESNDKA